MSSIIIGTAGHIDHGKSALVRALTGTDPDRLPEEKKRGITIDLGFADLKLDDISFAFVDVPGHERFVKNMLAGAHGIDVLALVIAADEGVMPQTREHFDICRLLNIRTGLVVITKTDLVDDEMLILVEEEARELVRGSFLKDSPIVPVSSKTHTGLDRLKTTLKEIALRTPPRSDDLVTRLPVDRAFSMKGFGPVVTGTLISDEIAEGRELQLLPEDRRVRVRGLQVHGKSVAKAIAGQRTAINLGGIDVAQLSRGMVIAEPNTLQPTQILDAMIDVLPHASRAVKSRMRVRMHIGAAEVLGRVRVLDSTSEIPRGKTGMAQLSLEEPVVAVHGDRFIIRTYSPSMTIAGGVVLYPFAFKHRAKDISKTAQHLQLLMTSDPGQIVSTFVSASEVNGVRVEKLAASTGWKRDVLMRSISLAAEAEEIFNADGVLISKQHFAQLSENVLDEITNFHKREPLARGMLRETLREKVFAHAFPELFVAVLDELAKAGRLVAEKDTVRAATHNIGLSEAESRLQQTLEDIYLKAGVESPTIDDAFRKAGVSSSAKPQARKILQLLINYGSLVRVNNEIFMHQSVLQGLKSKLLAFASQHEPERLIDVAAFKDLAGVSRKYAIPLLEYFDRERVTRRAGDKRLILAALHKN
jgi:selenocysteine-specific elongation factor